MKRATGLRVHDVSIGHGQIAEAGHVAHVQCVCQLNQGEVLFASKTDEPYQITIGARNYAVGIEHGLLGMREGGTRKIVVPPQLTHVERKIYPQLSEHAILKYTLTLIKLQG